VRKNLGYLYAIQQGATWIADTDDDNFPYENWGDQIMENRALESLSEAKVVNIYRHFTDQFIWPRGLPLNAILGAKEAQLNPEAMHNVGVWQGLADKDPDVDAIYRLTIGKLINFEKRRPLVLESGTYCPFNSQNTIWPLKEAFPYLYIPLSVSFRFCDILRGYVAQRGLWALNAKLAFTEASVYQERNVHDFMKDFIDEIPCYKQVDAVIDFLDKVELEGDASKDFLCMYEGLQRWGVVDERDVKGAQAFVQDLKKSQF
jgi:hypothetical protein